MHMEVCFVGLKLSLQFYVGVIVHFNGLCRL